MKAPSWKLSVMGGIALLILVAAWKTLTSRSPEEKLRACFTDLSVSVPAYQSIRSFEASSLAVKGGYFSTTLELTEMQFQQLAMQVGKTSGELLTSNGAWLSSKSRLNPDYPWILTVKAIQPQAPASLYTVTIEGRQPDD